MKIIRIFFDSYNNEFVSNKWGYVFMSTVKSNNTNNFWVQLNVVSFYTGAYSHIFKVIKVSYNEVCHSLHLEQSFNDTEDVIPVNFVCAG